MSDRLRPRLRFEQLILWHGTESDSEKQRAALLCASRQVERARRVLALRRARLQALLDALEMVREPRQW